MNDGRPRRLADLTPCFQGVIPSIVATSDGKGTPNVTYVSQVYLVDDEHVALSCQFFNKTRRNLDENPIACVEIYDPVTMQAYRLDLRFLRSETSGPLFDAMALRIQAIASHTGMTGIFRLIAADVFEVLRLERVEGFLTEPVDDENGALSRDGLRSEVRGLQCISERINAASDLEHLLESVFEGLESYFGFTHTMVLLCEESCDRLVAIASRGYGESGVGAEVRIGDGIIGTVARQRRVLRMTGLDAGLRYGRAVRRETMTAVTTDSPVAEIPLPGLPDAQSTLAIPLAIRDRLVGVLAAESRDPMLFGEWHEAYLEIIGNQIALGIDRMLEDDEPETSERPTTVPAVATPRPPKPAAAHGVVYYRNDDCIFVDGEYLIRNVPARILWKLLREWNRDGRTEFTNRELRLDPALGLPPVKDNLESRLILLRQRLAEKCPPIQIVPTGRGRFSLRVTGNLEMVEK